MSETSVAHYRYFVSYSGVSLPLKLTGELEANQLDNRNTYFRARYDEAGRPQEIEKLVYGEVEMAHRYCYDPEGQLNSAEITAADGEVTQLSIPAK